MSADVFRRYLDILSEQAKPWGETPAAPDVTGMQPGEDRDLGGGSRVRLKPDGTIEYSGAWGTHRYNSDGQHIGYQSPSFSGHQVSFDAQGRKTQTYSAGPLRTKTGPEGSEVSYDTGLARFKARQDAAGNITHDTEMKEADVTPIKLPQRGLNRQQRQAPQLPALFNPRKISVLKNKTDPQHPAKGYFVGDSLEPQRRPVEEDRTTEDVLSKVRRGLNDYLRSIEHELDPDRALVNRAKQELRHSDLDKLIPLKIIRTHDGRDIKIVGNQADGFQVRINEKPLSTQFDSLDEAEIACEMYCHRRREKVALEQSKDYLEER